MNNRISLGRMNTLRVSHFAAQGAYLHGGPDGTILLPRRYVPEGLQEGDELEVFLYLDQEERIVATTEPPLAQVGDFAWLTVSWVNNFGAFLHWGPMKDLFVPFREQKMKMQKGHAYLVHVHLDPETYRIIASAKVERYLSQDMPPYKGGEAVDCLVWQKTDLGLKCIVDNKYSGLLFDSEVFRPLFGGDRVQTFVRQVRPDGKIDVMLQPSGRQQTLDFADTLTDYLIAHGGRCPSGDKTSPETIKEVFGVSKKTFKRAVGDLYKRRLIAIEEDGIRLLSF